MPNLLPRRILLGLLAGPVFPAMAAPPLAVLASFSILADFARKVGGGRVKLAALVGPGQDAHAYQPRPSDARAVAAARVLILNGLGFEGWMRRLTDGAGFRGVAVTASHGVRPLRAGGQDENGAADPHAWQDVANAKIYVGNIRDGLSQADPDGAGHYAAAAASYLAELDELDGEIRATWASVPRPARTILTSHEAFGYYGHAYGVDFLAPQGLAEQSEPTPRQLAALIAQVRARRVRALFVETIANQQIMRQIARETGARIGPAVYSDALSEPAGPAGSYLDMMRHNTNAFVAALR